MSKISIETLRAKSWSIADTLRGKVKSTDYGKYILPLLIIKRLNDELLNVHNDVIDEYDKCKTCIDSVKDARLRKASRRNFYNTSNYTYQTALDDPDKVYDNFMNFLDGFSNNIQDIIKCYDLKTYINKLNELNILYATLANYNSADFNLSEDNVTAEDMGNIFQWNLEKYTEGSDQGEDFTSDDIVNLMIDILLEKNRVWEINEKVISVYDQTCGTGEMLFVFIKRLMSKNPTLKVVVYGQESNPETYAIAKSEFLIRNLDESKIKLGDTLSEDQLKGEKFDYVISNPPFGIEWKTAKNKVEQEQKNEGFDGRFGPKLPAISDGQQLFDLNGLAKLDDENGCMAIVHNGSPLFNGDAESGQSEIRKYIIENDWLDTIIGMPTDLFHNTNIATYIWIINKNKKHPGRVQLIDATTCFKPRRKPIGKKRVDIAPECRKVIMQAVLSYTDGVFTENKLSVESKIFTNNHFGYTKIAIRTPQFDESGNIITKGKNKTIVVDTSKNDAENVPLDEDIKTYFDREVIPYNKNAFIDEKSNKIGYEISFNKYFYKYVEPEKSEDILKKISARQLKLEEEIKKI